MKADAISERKKKSPMKWKATNEIGKNAAIYEVGEEWTGGGAKNERKNANKAIALRCAHRINKMWKRLKKKNADSVLNLNMCYQ